ncbi:MAG: transglutaminase family protein [Sediminibacterium sp.]|jgi:regulator of sirC expression with transglutaminase-like and TPR domain
MQANREITALFTLIDDPDEEVYTTVSEKIVAYGNSIIPNLEHLWETTLNDSIQERIEMIIHRLHFTDQTNELIEWRDSAYQDLLLGALIVSKFLDPEVNSTPVLQEFEKIRKNVWLELNNFLTPLEQANVLSSILYHYYHLKGVELSYDNADDFSIQKVLAAKKGNERSNAIVYQVLCELLDINAKIINIPKLSIIAFYHSDYDPATQIGHPQEFIHFYIDSTNGQAFSHKDIEGYFKKIGQEPKAAFFKPCSHKKIIQQLLQETAKCFALPINEYKQKELVYLSSLLDE